MQRTIPHWVSESTVKNRRKLRLAGTSVRIVGLDFAGFQGVGVDFLAKSK
jgi:hypothetical protein